MIVFAPRACSILYGLLRSEERPFLIPANICPVVPATFVEAGRAFEPVDVAELTLEIDADACLDRIQREPVGGLLFVRPYGRERDADPFFRVLKELQPDLLLIDDKCLCRPDCEGLGISPWADATLFSTGYAKHVDLGYGGFAHLREGLPLLLPGTCESWLDLRKPEVSWEEHRRRTGEALGRADEHKRRLNAIYAEALPREIQMDTGFQSWRFNVRVSEADRLVERLFAAGLFASRHYAPVDGGGRFPVAERLHGDVVNLFNDRYFDEERAERTARVVIQHLVGEEGDPAQAGSPPQRFDC